MSDSLQSPSKSQGAFFYGTQQAVSKFIQKCSIRPRIVKT